MPYWRKFTLYVIIAVSVTFGIAYLLGSLGRVINIIFSFTAGYVFGLPVGISFFGEAFSEPKLIKIAYAFEQATKARRAPRFLERAAFST